MSQQTLEKLEKPVMSIQEKYKAKHKIIEISQKIKKAQLTEVERTQLQKKVTTILKKIQDDTLPVKQFNIMLSEIIVYLIKKDSYQ